MHHSRRPAAPWWPAALVLTAVLAGLRADGQVIGTLQPRKPNQGTASEFQRLAASPDGSKLLARGASDVSIWDIRSGKITLSLEGAAYSSWSELDAVWLPGQSAVALACYGRGEDGSPVLIVDTTAGRTIRSLPKQGTKIAASPDGRWFAALSNEDEKVVFLYDAKTWVKVGSLEVGGRVHTLAFSPDGRTLAVSRGDATDALRLWDVATRAVRASTKQLVPSVSSLAFSPTGSLLAGIAEQKIQFWDPSTLQPKGSIALGSDEVSQLAFSPDGRTLAGTWRPYYYAVQFWDVGRLKPLAELSGHDAKTLAFVDAGKALATAGGQEGVVLWDWESLLRTVEPRATLATYPPVAEGSSSDARALAFSPDGRLLAVSSHQPSEVSKNPVASEMLARLRSQLEPGSVPERGKGAVKVWDVATGKVARDLVAGGNIQAELFYALRFGPDSRILYGVAQWGHVEWHVPSGRVMRSREAEKYLKGLSIVPGRGAWLISDGVPGSDDNLGVIDAVSGKTLFALSKPSPTSFAFTSDSKRVTTGLGLWDLAANELVVKPARGELDGFDTALTPDESTVITRTSDGTILTWDVATGEVKQPIARFLEHGRRDATSMCLLPGGTVLATASLDGVVRLWDFRKDRLLANLVGHKGPARAVTHTAKGDAVASVGDDGTTRIWDVSGIVPAVGGVARTVPVARPTSLKLRARNGAEISIQFDRAATEEEVESALVDALEQRRGRPKGGK